MNQSDLWTKIEIKSDQTSIMDTPPCAIKVYNLDWNLKYPLS